MKVKKILALALAGVMTLSMGMVAFAEDAYTDETTVDVPKIYTLTNANTANPTETFSFTITAESVSDSQLTVADMPAINNGSFTIGYAAGEATTVGDKNTATLTLPTFSSVGVYTYKITETPGTTAGVTYESKPVYLKITVAQDESGLKRIVAMHYESEDGAKLDNDTSLGFDNIYSAAEQISISKIVTGNMGDKSKYFDVVVTVNNPDDKSAPATYEVVGGTNASNPSTITAGVATTFKIKDKETINIKNVPYGVTYTVVEADYTGEGYDAAAYTGTDVKDNVVEGNVDAATETVTITNNKGGEVDTGISLDNLPYILLLCLVAFGAAALFFKKRNVLDR